MGRAGERVAIPEALILDSELPDHLHRTYEALLILARWRTQGSPIG